MGNSSRDEFTAKTKDQIAKRAGLLCSFPGCSRPTVGSNDAGDGEISIGVAAHICAAALGGPRYDPRMTTEDRKSTNNGIWLCQNHAKVIDSQPSEYSAERLREWKSQAQKDAWQRVRDSPEVAHAQLDAEPHALIRTAAARDLEVYRGSDNWPSSAIPLTLEIDGINVSTPALAKVLIERGDLVLVAAPGMGKTTTMFQVAEALVANSAAPPIVVPLGDWSTDVTPMLDSVLERPAFRCISRTDLWSAAEKKGLVLLLDGWNELDSVARRRAAAQAMNLQLQFPKLSLLISTRRQALDVPVDGTRINVQPLDEAQQIEIARRLRGNEGERIVDLAWQASGIRELITIPLYLTVLLSLPEGEPFPTSKEEALRRFVAVHERKNQRTEGVAAVTHGLHRRFLEDLAACATGAGNTTFAEAVARRRVSETVSALVAEGQITERPQPDSVLETLANYHVLVRTREPAGYSFQHQQFQEWYASHHAERRILASADEGTSRQALQDEILNHPMWEEAILFACDRLTRGDLKQQEACGKAILAAFSVDPILAAEMINRSTDAVWERVAAAVRQLSIGWHTPGRVDRALRFMVTSGRPEFADQVWPLITHESDQIHLRALRSGTHFRPSVLGDDAASRLAALPPIIRQTVLCEVVFNSGIEGLDLAAGVAATDPNSEVKAAVAAALSRRRADRHVADVLRGASDEALDLTPYDVLTQDVKDAPFQARLIAAQRRRQKGYAGFYDQLYALVYGRLDGDRSTELQTFVAEADIDSFHGYRASLIYEAKKRFPRAVAQGIRRRVREGRQLPYDASFLMADSGVTSDENAMRAIALGSRTHDDRATAAASVLGSQAVGYMIDELFSAERAAANAYGSYDEAARDRCQLIQGRLGHAQTTSLVAAVAARSAQAGNHEIARLADLLSRHLDSKNALDTSPLADVVALVKDWGSRLLSSADATRAQFAAIATLASCSPSEELLPVLKLLLDEDLSRWREFKERWHANRHPNHTAKNEAAMSWTLQYQRAFSAVDCPKTATMMREYLLDEDFGRSAALVLVGQWRAANDPSEDVHWAIGPDLSRVSERRSDRASAPAASSTEANAIFDAVEMLLSGESSKSRERQAVALGIMGAQLPHGRRDNTIEALIALADRCLRVELLTSLVLSGEVIEIDLVKHGIAEVIDVAQSQPRILTDETELKDWLRLLPFSNRPADAVDIVRALPEQLRAPTALRELLDALGHAPSDDGEHVLFELAKDDPRLYANGAWRDAVIRPKSLTAAMRFVDLAMEGILVHNSVWNRWHLSTHIGDLIGEHSELRAHVYRLLQNGATTAGLRLLAESVAKNPDTDGLLLLIQIETMYGTAFASRHTIERVVTQHISVDNGRGLYHVVPLAVAELRKTLLSMTTDGSPADAAARCLTLIDEIRDDYGIPESEPRHPDLASGKTWPILVHHADVP